MRCGPSRNLVFIRVWERQIPEYEARGWRLSHMRDSTHSDVQGDGGRDAWMVADGGPAFRSQHTDQKYLDELFGDDVWTKGWEWQRGDQKAGGPS